MNILLLTATKEYSINNGASYLSASYANTERYSDLVMFIPDNGDPITANPTIPIYPLADTITVDTNVRAPGYFTPLTLVTLLKSVFPKANTGSGGTGTTTQNGVTYHMLTDAEYTALQAILNVNNNAL